MIGFTFKRPPMPAIVCYLVGFLIIGVTMAHQFLHWAILSAKTNQQIFIAGALIVTLGSLLNWVLPIVRKHRGTKDSST